MPASFIFATARGRPEQVEGRGAGRGSGRIKGALSEGEKRGDSQGRDGQRDGAAGRDGAVAAKAEAKKSVSTACETDFSIAIHCRTKAGTRVLRIQRPLPSPGTDAHRSPNDRPVPNLPCPAQEFVNSRLLRRVLEVTCPDVSARPACTHPGPEVTERYSAAASPAARAFCVRRVISPSTSLRLVSMRSASSSTTQTM